MTRFEYGNPQSQRVLIQLVDDNDLSGIENEVQTIRELAGDDFALIALKVEDWNLDLSPWEAPAVFGKMDFGGGAEKTLQKVLEEMTDHGKTYYIGGYSLAGLFALWAGYQTDVFAGIAAASPSVWFPGFIEYQNTAALQANRVYLSLGDKEEKAKNPVMATVGDCIRTMYQNLTNKGIPCILEWNEGNHFKDADIRTAKAFAWLLNE